MTAIIDCIEISKVYGKGMLTEHVLRNITLSCHRGETCVLLGPSGSGKTTLLSILGLLLSPTSGELRLHGRVVNYQSQRDLITMRRAHIGFVFQQARLLPFLTMEDNLKLVGKNAGITHSELSQRIDMIMNALDIKPLKKKKPAQASGGQKQRVAIARALLHRPSILLADEPTATLDWQHAETAMRLLVEQAKATDALLIAVTHDTRLVSLFDRVLRIENSKLQE